MLFELFWRPGGSVGFLINLFGFFELTMMVVRGREVTCCQGRLLVDAISAILLSKKCRLARLVAERKENQSERSPVLL